MGLFWAWDLAPRSRRRARGGHCVPRSLGWPFEVVATPGPSSDCLFVTVGWAAATGLVLMALAPNAVWASCCACFGLYVWGAVLSAIWHLLS